MGLLVSLLCVASFPKELAVLANNALLTDALRLQLRRAHRAAKRGR